MYKRWLYLSLIFVVIVSFLTHRYFLNNHQLSVSPEICQERISAKIFETGFYDQAEKESYRYATKPDSVVFGGIIPHHLLAAPLISGFFRELSGQNISTIILLSTDHYDLQKQHISFSGSCFVTPYGDLLPDLNKQEILTNGAIREEKEVYNSEHGVYGITPFIKKYFPKAKFIPLVIKNSAKKEELDELALLLQKVADNNTLVIASVDFSHGLTSGEADKYDNESIKLIQSFQAEQILALDPVKNMDSPVAVYVLVKLMQDIGADKTLFLANTNSGKLTSQPLLPEVTSYVTAYFLR